MLRLRFHRRMLLALAGAVVLAAVGTTVGLALSDREASSSWELPAHDLAATRHGGRIAGTKVNWHVDMKGGVAGAPAIVDGTVYAASIGGRSRRSPWRPGELTGGVRLPLLSTAAARASAGSASSIAVGTDRLVAASDRVIALDRRTGRTLLDDQAATNEHEQRLLLGTARDCGGPLPRRLGLRCGVAHRTWPAECLLAKRRLSRLEHAHGSAGGERRRRHRSCQCRPAHEARLCRHRFSLPCPTGRNPNTDSLLALQLGNGAISGRTRSTRATSMDSTSTVRR
jgi:hypothetical protein